MRSGTQKKTGGVSEKPYSRTPPQKINQMVKGYVRHKVADFDKWKMVYDQHDSTRKNGLRNLKYSETRKIPMKYWFVTEWDSKNKALLSLILPASLKSAMQNLNAGVVSAPEFICRVSSDTNFCGHSASAKLTSEINLLFLQIISVYEIIEDHSWIL